MTNVFSKIGIVLLRSTVILACTLLVFLPSITNGSQPGVDVKVTIEWLTCAAPPPSVLVFGSLASAYSRKNMVQTLRVGMSLAGIPFLVKLSQVGIGNSMVVVAAASAWILILDWMYWVSTRGDEDGEGYLTLKQLADVIGHLRGARPSEVIPMTTGGHNGDLLSLSSVRRPDLTLLTQTYDPESEALECTECRPLLHGEEETLV